MGNNVAMIKVFRIFFTIGIILAVIGALSSGAPIYVPLALIIVGGAMVLFMGKRMKALKEEDNDK